MQKKIFSDRTRPSYPESVYYHIYTCVLQHRLVNRPVLWLTSIEVSRRRNGLLPRKLEYSWSLLAHVSNIWSEIANHSLLLVGSDAESLRMIPPREPNGRDLVRLIKVASSSLRSGQPIHAYVAKTGFGSSEHVSTALIGLYVRASSIASARKVFDEIPQPGLVSWTAMIRAYVTASYPRDALLLFKAMMYSASLTPDPVALATAVSACRQMGNLGAAKMIHGLVCTSRIEIDAFVSTELIGAYGDEGELVLARHLFDEMHVKTLVAWNAIIHQYVKSESTEVAQCLFNEMPTRDAISWNTIISGLSRMGRCREALAMFHEMEFSPMRPNNLTMCTVLSACASLGALETGMWVHAYIERKRMNLDGSLDHCLVDMYAKCGSIEKAVQVFEKVLKRKDLYSWTSIICGLAMHGHADHALCLFSQMQDAGVKPDDATLVGVLNACAHGGLLAQGCQYFYAMEEKYGLASKIEHYGCMVDLFSRTGHLREAYNMITEMPMNPNTVIWGTLLSGCKVHNDMKLGEVAATKLIELDPSDQWARVMLSNIYAGACNWGGVMRLRKEMKEVGMKKAPGCSSIEVHGEVHEFLARGSLHAKHSKICSMLEAVEAHMQCLDD